MTFFTLFSELLSFFLALQCIIIKVYYWQCINLLPCNFRFHIVLSAIINDWIFYLILRTRQDIAHQFFKTIVTFYLNIFFIVLLCCLLFCLFNAQKVWPCRQYYLDDVLYVCLFVKCHGTSSTDIAGCRLWWGKYIRKKCR